MNQEYDYIIAGAGAAGLSLAYKMLHPFFDDKRILVVDESLNPSHNKTWCFWDNKTPPFADLMYRQWNNAEVSISGKRIKSPLNEYTYYCLRSIDFQEQILRRLKKESRFDFLESTIEDLSVSYGIPILQTKSNSYQAEFIFQSCFSPWNSSTDQPDYPLLQHFLGWEVKTTKPVFDDAFFTLMDFDDTFDEGIAFIYLLPWSKTSALIEYTIFSDELLSREKYEEKISIYLNNRYNLKPIDYKITRTEFGEIPMKDRPHKPWYDTRILNIGTVGGVTKPSTGYTFSRIQKQTDQIIRDLQTDEKPNAHSPSKTRFKAYDLWLLQIIHDHPSEAYHVFNQLFKNNSMDAIFSFLAEESAITDDFKIMSSVPYTPFFRAIWQTKERLLEI
ncbi:lycopene cyclase family protein [Fodinibius sp. N2]|uniref:lycopene cyclase family protein n=1 Tax=Fodinibius alkaliphilus TaxID=3140241 RepID=UPI00315B16AE